MRVLRLPRADGSIEEFTPAAAAPFAPPPGPPRSRVCFAAAHVVADPLAPGDPDGPAQLDWDATLAYRRHLWAHGFSVAEAMDTAQRGMGLDWPASRELIRSTLVEARALGTTDRVACGAGTDQLPPGRYSIEHVISAYAEQCAFVGESPADVQTGERQRVRQS